MRVPVGPFTGLLLCACSGVAHPPGRGHDLTIATFEGPPSVRFVGPGRLTWEDLADGPAGMRVDCPEGFPCAFALVDDRDGNGRPDPGEERRSFPLVPGDQGWVVAGVRLTSAERARFERPLVVFEFTLGGAPQVHTRALE